MKLLLSTFEQLSGLKINFHKSEIFCFGKAKEYEVSYSQLFGCDIGKYPFRYLGLPMHFRKLNNKDWKMIEERIEKRLSGGKGKMLITVKSSNVYAVFFRGSKRSIREDKSVLDQDYYYYYFAKRPTQEKI